MPDLFYFDSSPTSFSDIFGDSHAHIQYEDFDADRDEVIQRAKDAGLKFIVCIGTNLESTKQGVALAKKYPGYVYATVGNHPYEADNSMDGFEELIDANKEYIVGIGETGLDFFRSQVPHDVQMESFKSHSKLAKKYDLPIIIHLREVDDCYPFAINILKEIGVPKAIFHCFAGTRQMAEEIWSNGWKTSFSLMITYPKNAELREIYENCPLVNLLVETDSPYLPPQKKRGERNEPGELAVLT